MAETERAVSTSALGPLAAHTKPAGVMLVASFALSLVRFRGTLIRELLQRGHLITCCAPERRDQVPAAIEALEGWGARYMTLPVAGAGLSMFSDLRYLWRLRQAIRYVRPDVVLAYTIKPVIYAPIAAALIPACRGRVYSMVTGLGYAFTPGGEFRRTVARFVIERLLRISMPRTEGVVFFNPDDLRLLSDRKLIPRKLPVCVVGGSGVDLQDFSPCPLPGPPMTFLMMARLLADKGVREYVAAARLVRQHHPETRFLLLGPPDPNPSGISAAEAAKWSMEGLIEHHRTFVDPRTHLSQCDVFVLPSYREGLPRSNLEAMAMGRPVITTDTPGCRETVEDGQNGFLVPPRDAVALAAAMRRFVEQPMLAAEMGAYGRRLVEQRFNVHTVNFKLLDFIGLA